MKVMTKSGAATSLIGVTMGDPAGIGPEIVLKALADTALAEKCLVIGDAGHLRHLANRFGINSSILDPASEQPGIKAIDLKNVPADAPVGVDAAVTGQAA